MRFCATARLLQRLLLFEVPRQAQRRLALQQHQVVASQDSLGLALFRHQDVVNVAAQHDEQRLEDTLAAFHGRSPARS